MLCSQGIPGRPARLLDDPTNRPLENPQARRFEPDRGRPRRWTSRPLSAISRSRPSPTSPRSARPDMIDPTGLAGPTEGDQGPRDVSDIDEVAPDLKVANRQADRPGASSQFDERSGPGPESSANPARSG